MPSSAIFLRHSCARSPDKVMRAGGRLEQLHVIHVKPVGSSMAAKHNITVVIEPSLLKKARAIAAHRGLSVSALLVDELRDLVAADARYAAARKRAVALFSTPLPLGNTSAARDELHERRGLR
jgi:hypothetical protein